MTAHSSFRIVGQPDEPSETSQRVYVVDDHYEVRQSLEFLLGTFQIATRSFADAGKFLDQLPTLVPAPILLDITMPGISGIELLETLAGRGVIWPVLIMTGLSDQPLASRALRLGAMSVLQKPFSAEDLERTVRTALAAMADIDVASPERPADVAR